MKSPSLPSAARMHRAVRERAPSFDGVFLMGVRTTGIFCRASCPARRPAPRNVEFFADAAGARRAGYRAWLRCRPTVPPGDAPVWLRPLLDDPRFAAGERVTDAEVRRLGLDPVRVRRWFLRARRVGGALRRLRRGEAVANASIDAGYESLSGFYDAFRRIAGTPPARGRDVVPLHLARLVPPLGPMVAAATDAGLCLLAFDDRRTNEREARGAAAPRRDGAR